MHNKILLMILFVLIVGCVSKEPKTIGVYIFVDVTDGTMEAKSTIDHDLKQLSKFTDVSEDKGGDNGIELRVFQINNLSASSSKTMILNKGIPGMLGQNSLDRQDEIKLFNTQIKDALFAIKQSGREELSQSKVYQNLCRKLSGLQFEHDKNLVIIYSDMLENSELFSFYKDKAKIAKWEENIEMGIAFLESNDCSFPDLKNVQLHIIQERKSENDALINRAQSFWEKLFKTKGAVVSFDAELNLKSGL